MIVDDRHVSVIHSQRHLSVIHSQHHCVITAFFFPNELLLTILWHILNDLLVVFGGDFIFRHWEPSIRSEGICEILPRVVQRRHMVVVWNCDTASLWMGVDTLQDESLSILGCLHSNVLICNATVFLSQSLHASPVHVRLVLHVQAPDPWFYGIAFDFIARDHEYRVNKRVSELM